MTVMWLTNRNTTGWVEFGEIGAPPKRAAASHHGLIDANERIHRIALTGLRPGCTYRYKVFSRDILNFGTSRVQYGETAASAEYEFRTFDRGKREFSFLVFNDIHQTESVLPEMLAAAGPEPYDFVFFNGDILSQIVEESQITGILDSAVKLFASRVPLIWGRGNHETRGPFARTLPKFLGLPSGSFYYSFDHGPAHFTILDTGEDKSDADVEYSGLADFERYRLEERDWLAKEVHTPEFRNAQFRIGIAHMPFPEPAGRWSGVENAYQNFGEILNGSGLDILICAHKHAAAVVEPAPGTRHKYPIVRGGGPTPANRTVIRVRVKPDALKAEIMGPGGNVIAEREVRRSR
jgi:predicted phosphodiesterase